MLARGQIVLMNKLINLRAAVHKKVMMHYNRFTRRGAMCCILYEIVFQANFMCGFTFTAPNTSGLVQTGSDSSHNVHTAVHSRQ